MSVVLGVDIGGTGIKAALVDTGRGSCVGAKRHVATPQPATPVAVTETIVDLVLSLEWDGPLGVGFPGVVKRGVVATAANLDQTWIGIDARALLSNGVGARAVSVINDADAAGLAEVQFGAGSGTDGVVIMITLGTGIGTGVFSHGALVPNSEFGHIVIHGIEAETHASARAKVDSDMTWKHWSGHLRDFLLELERLLWPDLFIIGGGISAEFRSFCESIRTRTPTIAAQLGNDAGIIGAALPIKQVIRT